MRRPAALPTTPPCLTVPVPTEPAGSAAAAAPPLRQNRRPPRSSRAASPPRTAPGRGRRTIGRAAARGAFGEGACGGRPYCAVVTAGWRAHPFRRKLRADIAPLSTLKASRSVQFVTGKLAMNASVYPVSSGLDSYGAPPVLIAASSERAARRAAETIAAADLPLISVPIEAAVDRLDRQGAASALWLELEDDGGPELDRLLERVEAEAGNGAFPAIIAAPASLIDAITTRIAHRSIEVVIDGTPIDRIEALALALARSRQDKSGVHEDISREPSSARLRQLSDEVSR